MLTILVFIIILGLLIFVHEAGHFVAARKNGMKAEEFGFGFPPRIFGIVKDKENKKWRIVWGNKDVKSKNTVYSMNWIPLGGFVKIKGEDGSCKNEKDSFAAGPAWRKIIVLLAGVAMNFVLAWILISIALMIGAPQDVAGLTEKDQTYIKGDQYKIQVAEVRPDSPADEMGLLVGDELIKCKSIKEGECSRKFAEISEIQEFINNHKGEEISLYIRRGKDLDKLSGIPRAEFPETEGPLGIALSKTVLVAYPWYASIWMGAVTVYNITVLIFVTFFALIKNWIMGSPTPGVDVAGPIGIAYFTKQVTTLGFVYILQFAALLSINLGIINAFPFPALDGGRILFILVEKIKGSPISQKVENKIHTAGFVFLIGLMILVTFRDLIRFDIWGKIRGWF